MFKNTKFLWLVIVAVLVGALELLSLGGIHFPASIKIPLILMIILGIGYQTLWHGLQALLKLNFKSINLLMLIAVAGAFYLGKYEEAAVIIVLYTLAEKLEDIGIEKSQSALSALLEKMPKLVTLKGQNQQVSVEEVKVDDIVIIKPGEMIALDGKIVMGSSYVDEAAITGEPIPKDKFIGDTVFAGTLNKQGFLEIQVLKASKDTTFAKIREITFQATQVKAKTQKFIETFSQYYTPAVVILAFILIVFPPLFLGQTFNPWLLKGLTLLVIACPCALVISTPISIFSAIGNASTQGAVIKGGLFLETMGQLKAIAFDKTRTLTYGQPIVTDILPFGKSTKEQLLACAAGLEIFSEHPLAQSIVDAANKENLTLHEFENFKSILGKGAKADCLVCEDVHHCIGNLSFILEEHPVSEAIIIEIDRLQKQGKTAIIIASNQGVEGVIALMDEIRPESRSLISDLKQLGIASIMLTGDHKVSAQAVANDLGITDVRASLLPQDKAEAMKNLVDHYKVVAMVGDGVNDAPALALSSVGITIGSLGSDTAIEAASIVIMSDRLDIIPFLIKLGKRTTRFIQFNSGLAVTVKLLFITLALIGISNLALAIFADVGITVVVVLNSLRLMHWKAK